MTKVNRTLETPLGKFALEKMNEALTVSEEYVEKYLPPSDEEMNNKGTNLCQFSSEVENRKVKVIWNDSKGIGHLRKRNKTKLRIKIIIGQ